MENQLLKQKDIVDLSEFLKYCGRSLLNDLQYYAMLRQKINDENVDDTHSEIFNALKEKNRLITLLDNALKGINTPEHNTKDTYNFFIYLDLGNDDVSDPFEININRDLFIDDFIDLGDHEIMDKIESDTNIFRVVKRQFSLEYQEMFLHLEPFHV